MTTQHDGLSNDLQERAVVLAGEMAWLPSDACALIDYLAEHNYAIFGVELWQAHAGHPKWLATSHNTCEIPEDWMNYVRCCADHARCFVQHFSDEKGALFNFSWGPDSCGPTPESDVGPLIPR